MTESMNPFADVDVFLCSVCPNCGRRCGNGGRGLTVFCSCGWSGEAVSPEDAEVIADFLRSSMERDEEPR